MKNICFVCYDLSVMGGAEKVATSVSAAMCDNYKVHMISLTGGNPLLPLDNRITYVNLNLDLSRLRKGIIPAVKALKQYYRENDIALSFLEGNYAGLVCCMTSLFTDTKQVFCDHGSLMSQWDKADIRTIRRIASKFCDYTLVLTGESMEDYIKKFHIKRERISYIHNWIDNIPKNTVYNNKSKLIISAGRFAKEKQFHTLLPHVAYQVFKKHPDWKWHIYGDGEYFEQTKKRIEEMDLENFVILMGKSDDLERVYKEYAMCVMTSEREGMPLVLLEAKAWGLPMVAFDIKTGPCEIICDKKDGFLVPFGDIKAMANCICNLADSVELREQMSSFACDDRERFSKEKILSKWTDFIEYK